MKVTALNVVDLLEERRARSRELGSKVVYASPERLRTLNLDARADLFSVGAILHELLTGQTFDRAAPRAPLPADIPGDLANLADGLLHDTPEVCRPHRADEALEILRRGGEPIASRAELGALVIVTQQGQRGPTGRGASGRHKLEILEPGHVLVRRSAIMYEQEVLDAERALRAVRPPRSPKRTRLIRHGTAGRAAFIIVLMAACVALGALLHASFLANGQADRPVGDEPT